MNNENNNKNHVSDAMISPDKVYQSPKDVLSAPNLSKREKIKVLEAWKHDAIELEVADDENMTTHRSKDRLAEILEALRQLEEEE